MDQFTQSYIETALWSSTDDYDIALLTNHTAADLAPEALKQIEEDCKAFQETNADVLSAWYEAGQDMSRAGHDFWLTRNGRGAGFWDRYMNEPGHTLGLKLTECAKAYGEVNLYVGDDGRIYC